MRLRLVIMQEQDKSKEQLQAICGRNREAGFFKAGVLDF